MAEPAACRKACGAPSSLAWCPVPSVPLRRRAARRTHTSWTPASWSASSSFAASSRPHSTPWAAWSRTAPCEAPPPHPPAQLPAFWHSHKACRARRDRTAARLLSPSRAGTSCPTWSTNATTASWSAFTRRRCWPWCSSGARWTRTACPSASCPGPWSRSRAASRRCGAAGPQSQARRAAHGAAQRRAAD